ncbi:MAG: hypothetical protein ABL882_06845 [Sphingopyxis sp.]
MTASPLIVALWRTAALRAIGCISNFFTMMRYYELMGMIALAMFIGLWGWGHQMFGWSDPDGQIQLALFASFIFGIIGGYRVKD